MTEDKIKVDGVTIKSGYDGVYVISDGEDRYISSEELRRLAKSDDPVEIR